MDSWTVPYVLTLQEHQDSKDKSNIEISGHRIRRYPMGLRDRRLTSSLNDISRLYHTHSPQHNSRPISSTDVQRHRYNLLNVNDNGLQIKLPSNTLQGVTNFQTNNRALQNLSPIQFHGSYQDKHGQINHRNCNRRDVSIQTSTPEESPAKNTLKLKAQSENYSRVPRTLSKDSVVSERSSNIRGTYSHQQDDSIYEQSTRLNYGNTSSCEHDTNLVVSQKSCRATATSLRRLFVLQNISPLPLSLAGVSQFSEVTDSPWMKTRIQTVGYPFKIQTPVLDFNKASVKKGVMNITNNSNNVQILEPIAHPSSDFQTRYRFNSGRQKNEIDTNIGKVSGLLSKPSYTHRPDFHKYHISHPIDSVVGKILQRRHQQFHQNQMQLLADEYKEAEIEPGQYSINGLIRVNSCWQNNKTDLPLDDHVPPNNDAKTAEIVPAEEDHFVNNQRESSDSSAHKIQIFGTTTNTSENIGLSEETDFDVNYEKRKFEKVQVKDHEDIICTNDSKCESFIEKDVVSGSREEASKLDCAKSQSVLFNSLPTSGNKSDIYDHIKQETKVNETHKIEISFNDKHNDDSKRNAHKNNLTVGCEDNHAEKFKTDIKANKSDNKDTATISNKFEHTEFHKTDSNVLSANAMSKRLQNSIKIQTKSEKERHLLSKPQNPNKVNAYKPLLPPKYDENSLTVTRPSPSSRPGTGRNQTDFKFLIMSHQNRPTSGVSDGSTMDSNQKRDWIVVRDYKSTQLGNYGSKYNVWNNKPRTKQGIDTDIKQETGISDNHKHSRPHINHSERENDGGSFNIDANNNDQCSKITPYRLRALASSESHVASRLSWKLSELASKRSYRYQQARQTSNPKNAGSINQPISREKDPRQGKRGPELRPSSRGALAQGLQQNNVLPYRILSPDLVGNSKGSPSCIDVIHKSHVAIRNTNSPQKYGTASYSPRNTKIPMSKCQATELVHNVNNSQAKHSGNSTQEFEQTNYNSSTQEILDYFWSYQGMGRQILHANSSESSLLQGKQFLKYQSNAATIENNELPPLNHPSSIIDHEKENYHITNTGVDESHDDRVSQGQGLTQDEMREKRKIHLIVKLPIHESNGED